MAKTIAVPEVEEMSEHVASIGLDVEYALRHGEKKDYKRVMHALARIAEGIVQLAKKCDLAKRVRDPKAKQEEPPTHNP